MITPSMAHHFAIMLQAGLPAEDAILYFTESEDPSEIKELLGGFLRSKALKTAMLALQGKPWQEMSLNEKISSALDLHYAGLAYFLFTHNYGSLGREDRSKADVARVALEAKLAGTAGKSDPLSRFLEDFTAGKLKERLITSSAGVAGVH